MNYVTLLIIYRNYSYLNDVFPRHEICFYTKFYTESRIRHVKLCINIFNTAFHNYYVIITLLKSKNFHVFIMYTCQLIFLLKVKYPFYRKETNIRGLFGKYVDKAHA